MICLRLLGVEKTSPKSTSAATMNSDDLRNVGNGERPQNNGDVEKVAIFQTQKLEHTSETGTAQKCDGGIRRANFGKSNLRLPTAPGCPL